MRHFKRVPRVKKGKIIAREILVVPIHVYLEKLPIDRVLLRYMFPEDGTVSNFLLFLGETPIAYAPTDETIVKMTIANEGVGSFYDFPVLKGVNRLEQPITFKAQDRVVLEMGGSASEYKDIWISFLFRSQM